MSKKIDHNSNIGTKVKRLRTSKKYTLKKLSDETGLSIGFLSQFERGISTIAIDSLAKIATVLDTDLSSLFRAPAQKNHEAVVRSFEPEHLAINPHIIQYTLSNNVTGFNFLPRVFELMPSSDQEESMEMYNHNGQEFIYVLEGVLNIVVGDDVHVLYPGDSMQILSNVDHNWINKTNKITKFLSINTPNPFLSENE